jgi:esterase/lipase
MNLLSIALFKKMKKVILLNVIVLLIYPAIFAQKIIGNWTGNIQVGAIELPIVFHFNKNTQGKLDGKWDSPKQNAIGLPFSSIDADEDSVRIRIKLIDGSFNGKFVNNDSITGTWTQAGRQLPLNFARSNSDGETQKISAAHANEKEIEIISAVGSKLYGTLLSKNNQQPLAIIIAGSGPTDRNGNSALVEKTNEYEMLADSLGSRNIASFRYDKRGVARSIPSDFDPSKIVFDDYEKDAEKVFDYLHDTLGFKNIYFIGHSEGSLIAMLASQKRNVKGYISVAGAGRPIDQVLDEQMKRQPLPDSVKQQIPVIFNQLKKGNEINDFPEQLSALFRKSIQSYLISWLKYAPQKEIKKLKCPVLILQGSCDIQVKETDANNLHQANKKSKLDIIPNMSHTLKNAGNDCVNEKETYTNGSMPLDQVLVNDIVCFINTTK